QRDQPSRNVTTPEKREKTLFLFLAQPLLTVMARRRFSAAAFRTARHWQADDGRYNLFDSSNGARNDEPPVRAFRALFLFQIKVWLHAHCYVHGTMRDFSRRSWPACRNAGSGANSPAAIM